MFFNLFLSLRKRNTQNADPSIFLFVEMNQEDDSCAYCKESKALPVKCTKCKTEYCNSKCKKAHAKKHKKNCTWLNAEEEISVFKFENPEGKGISLLLQPKVARFLGPDNLFPIPLDSESGFTAGIEQSVAIEKFNDFITDGRILKAKGAKEIYRRARKNPSTIETGFVRFTFHGFEHFAYCMINHDFTDAVGWSEFGLHPEVEKKAKDGEITTYMSVMKPLGFTKNPTKYIHYDVNPDELMAESYRFIPLSSPYFSLL